MAKTAGLRMDFKNHWSNVFRTKAPNEVSWHQDRPATSLRFIQQAVPDPAARIIDVGAGASTLVDHLLLAGYSDITLLDISAEALQTVCDRLGSAAPQIRCIEADITEAALEAAYFDVWHDRAVFHFLTTPLARQRYIDQVRRSVRVGGYVLVATFAPDGPTMCSGLPVERYSAVSLHHTFGQDFVLVSEQRETHQTPWNSAQNFMYCLCRVQPR